MVGSNIVSDPIFYLVKSEVFSLSIMSFYYISVFSLMLLSVIYVIGTGLLIWIGYRLRGKKFRWALVAPLALLIYVGPIAEELWIAWNFGQLCRKDAGIFVNKVVEVEGYYDATAGLRQIYKPLPAVTSENFERRGFKYYEMSLANTKGGPSKVAHFEKVNGEWTGTTLDKPAARYHYGKDSGVRVTHKIYRQTSRVTDKSLEEIIGHYVRYSREVPWFFLSLGDPGFGCDGADGGPYTKHSFLIYQNVLVPPKTNVEVVK